MEFGTRHQRRRRAQRAGQDQPARGGGHASAHALAARAELGRRGGVGQRRGAGRGTRAPARRRPHPGGALPARPRLGPGHRARPPSTAARAARATCSGSARWCSSGRRTSSWSRPARRRRAPPRHGSLPARPRAAPTCSATATSSNSATRCCARCARARRRRRAGRLHARAGESGARIQVARAALVRALVPTPVRPSRRSAVARSSGLATCPTAAWIPTATRSPPSQALARHPARRRAEELARGATLAGPHRDDLELLIGGRPARSAASQGQQRSIVLALKLAEVRHIAVHAAVMPVLLLDDVLSELDPRRRRDLIAGLADAGLQTLITSSEPLPGCCRPGRVASRWPPAAWPP